MRTRWVGAVGLAVVLVACSSGTKTDGGAAGAQAKATKAQTAAAEAAPVGATPQPSPADAVGGVLAAEQRGDHTASFAFLSAAGRATYPDVARWARRRTEMPVVTGFTIGGTTGNQVVATVTHNPGLDPFIGLSPAREQETWAVQHTPAGWLVDADPTMVPDLPDASKAVDVTLQWAKALQACDADGVRTLQAVPDLLGAGDVPATLCHAPGAVGVGAVQRAPAGPQTTDLVGQYGDAALSWARVVPVTGGPQPFSAVLAPWGDRWKVVGAISS